MSKKSSIHINKFEEEKNKNSYLAAIDFAVVREESKSYDLKIFSTIQNAKKHYRKVVPFEQNTQYLITSVFVFSREKLDKKSSIGNLYIHLLYITVEIF